MKMKRIFRTSAGTPPDKLTVREFAEWQRADQARMLQDVADFVTAVAERQLHAVTDAAPLH